VRRVRAFGRFWWDFVVGDEWRFAVVVGASAVLGAFAWAGHWARGGVIAVVLGSSLVVLVGAVILVTGKRRMRR
jgi:hypothetical protein